MLMECVLVSIVYFQLQSNHCTNVFQAIIIVYNYHYNQHNYCDMT